MAGSFARKATVQRATLRALLTGLSKSGKTFDALIIGESLIKTLSETNSLKGNGRICVIDSENGRSEFYADVIDFDVYDLSSFTPEAYIDAVTGAVNENYSVIIVDQISHEWAGSGGIIELVHNIHMSSGGKLNSFTAWNQGTPRHTKFIETLVRCPSHLICTARVKQEWDIVENDRGKKEPKKLGMAPVQRDSTDYEFDVVGTIDSNHYIRIESRGTLSRLLGDRTFIPGPDIDHPGEIVEIGQLIGKWIAGCVSAETLGLVSREQINEIQSLGDQIGWGYQKWKDFFGHLKINSLARMSLDQYEEQRVILQGVLERLRQKHQNSNSV